MKKTRSLKSKKSGKSKQRTSKTHESKQHSCNIIDTQLNYKSNNIWKTCIHKNAKNNIIYYITPKNVIIKSISTIQIPEFVLELNGKEQQCKIKIEDKFVSCFIYVNKRWHVITITSNTFIFENMRYYLLVDKLFKLNNAGKIILSTHQMVLNDTINVNNNDYTPVSTDSSVYKILKEFTFQKLIGTVAKLEVAFVGATGLLDYAL